MAESKEKKPEPTEPWLKPRKRLPPPGMSPAEQAAFLDQRDVELGIRGIISTEDVNVVDIMAYYNFGRQVMKRVCKWGAATPLQEDLAALIKKWSGMGAKEHILVRILNEFFQLNYPTGAAKT